MPASIAWWICMPSPLLAGPKELRQATREVAAAYIACGVDPKTLDHLQPVRRCPSMPSWRGSSIAWRGWAGSTA